MRLVMDNIAPDKGNDLIQLAIQLRANVEVIDSSEEEEDIVLAKVMEASKGEEIASKEEFETFLSSLSK